MLDIKLGERKASPRLFVDTIRTVYSKVQRGDRFTGRHKRKSSYMLDMSRSCCLLVLQKNCRNILIGQLTMNMGILSTLPVLLAMLKYALRDSFFQNGPMY